MGSLSSTEHVPLEGGVSSDLINNLILSNIPNNSTVVRHTYSAKSNNLTTFSLKIVRKQHLYYVYFHDEDKDGHKHDYSTERIKGDDGDVFTLAMKDSTNRIDLREGWCFTDLPEPEVEPGIKIVSIFTFFGQALPSRLYLKIKKL